MRKISSLALLMTVCLYPGLSSGQQAKDGSETVNGTTVVNEYSNVTGGATSGNTTISVGNANLNQNNRFDGPLEAGDLVMVIQMQGATIQGNTNDVDAWGEVTNYNGAGTFEVREVLSVNGNDIEFTCGLENDYNTAGGSVQVVRMPRYSDLTVNGEITSGAWDGNSGGIVAMEVEGNITINNGGSIDVTGLGFRGGQIENLSSADASAYYGDPAYTDPSLGAEKGESIAGWGPEYDALGGRYGRGAPANGGGGGNAHNSAGGGGANAGVVADWTGIGVPDPAYNAGWALENPSIVGQTSSGGGRGGYSFSFGAADPLVYGPGDPIYDFGLRHNVGGLGGRPLEYGNDEKLFFGGGGGAGDGNDGTANRGGNGGGLVFIKGYGDVSGNGSIIADGEPGETTTGQGLDAPGGGGGGGAIKIDVQGTVTGITVSAQGGDGGDQIIDQFTQGKGYDLGAEEGEGPGGGGGGGYVSITNSAVTANTDGGEYGVTDESQFANFPANGATGGGEGTSTAGTNWDFTLTDQTICPDNSVTLPVTEVGDVPNNMVYNWYTEETGGTSFHTGDSYDTPVLTETVTYWVEPCPGTFRKPVTVTIQNNPIIPMDDEAVCEGESVDVSPGTGFASYDWSTGENTPTITIDQTGTYSVTVTDANGCEGTGEMDLTVNPLPEPALTDGEICEGETHLFNAAGFQTYLWNTGAQTTSITVGTANTYTVTVTDANACEAQVSADLVVNPLPIVNTSPDQVVCGGDTVEIWATGGVTYSWTPATGLFTQDNDTTLAAPVTPTTYTVQVVDANGCEGEGETFLDVAPGGITVSPGGAICPGESFDMSASGGDVYTWSPGATLTTTTGPNTTATPDATTTYAITVADDLGCYQVDSITVEVYPEPLPELTNDSICDGETTTVDAGTWADYAWSDGTDAQTITIDIADTYSVTVTDDNGCVAVAQMDLIVHPLPVVNAGEDVRLCPGDTADLEATGADLYTWPSIPSIESPNTAATAAYPNNTTSYTVTGTTIYGCQGTDNVLVTIEPQPDATIDPAGPYCPDDGFLLLTAAQEGGVWSGNGIVNDTSGIFSPEAAGTGIHPIQYMIDGFCPDTGTIEIEIHDMDDPEITEVPPVCVNEVDFLLEAASPAGTWSGDGITDAATGLFSPTQAGVGLHTISFETTGACPRTDAIEIEVLDIPDPQITAIGPFCSDDDPAEVSATPDGGTWSGSILTGTQIVPSSDVVGTHEYHYTVTNQLGCSHTDTAEVDIVLAPEPIIIPYGPVCLSEPGVDLASSPSGGSWSGVGIIDPDAGSFLASGAGVGTHTVRYTVSNNGMCERFDEELVTVEPEYAPEILSSPMFCEYDPNDTLEVNTPIPGAWSGQGITDTDLGIFSPGTARAGTHAIVYAIEGACNTSDTVLIDVNPVPDPVISGKEFFCLEDDPYTFNITEPNGTWSGEGLSNSTDGIFTASLADLGTHLLSYVVEVKGCVGSDSIEIEVDEMTIEEIPGGQICNKNPNSVWALVADAPGATGYEWNTGASTPSISPRAGGIYTVTVTNEGGCTAEAVTEIINDCNCHLWMPNAFTPSNDDDLNNEFLAKGEAPINFTMRIYDRWGDKVFESFDMQVGWDGYFRNELAKPDVYNVKIECDIGGTQVGRVTVVR